MKVYRDIYFHGNAIGGFHGNTDIYYTGRIYNNAARMVGSGYDPKFDLYIVCGSCAAKRYRRLIKTDKK